MELCNVLLGSHELRRRSRLRVGVCHDLRLHASLGGLLLSDGLQISGALFCSLIQHRLVLCLRILLLKLHLLGLLLNVGNEHVHHCEDSPRFLALLLVRTDRLRWWWERGSIVSLCEANACSRDAAWWVGWRKRASHVQRDALFLRELTLWRRLIQFRIVEFLHPVLRKSNDLNGSIVVGLHRDKLDMFSFPGRRCISDVLVKLIDAVLKCLDLIGERGNHLLLLVDGLLQVRDRALELLLPVVR